MRHVTIVSSLVALAIVIALTGALAAPLAAQEATATAAGTPAAAPNFIVGQLAPLGQPFEAIPGIEVEFLNEGPSTQAPGQSLVLYRTTFHPGAELPTHIHPGTTVSTVESGTFSWTLQVGTVTVTRPGPRREQITKPGTEIVLHPGEGLAYNADVVHTAHAVGDEPAVVLFTSLFTTGQPLLTVTNEHGTPVTMGVAAQDGILQG
jgi:quercetin dioxygenase-like cupin family protein